jgi:SAM-dependent methyltransferase/predicted NAD-dependent protein-ADP-ribosyltransferase YbiA (DUF1768 family)
MSLELKAAEVSAIGTLWDTWVSSADTEIEATFKSVDYTSFLNVIKYLRSLGLEESVAPTKLNIMVEGGLRFTLMGDGPISAYCRDNTLKGKAFHVILKEKKSTGTAVGSEIDLPDYGVRVKVRRELPMNEYHPRVVEALNKWASLPKYFRYIKRYTFTSQAHKGIIFDASFVRENAKDRRGSPHMSTTFLGANISKQPIKYELEVEATERSGAQKSFMVGIMSVLRGLQKSYVPVRESVKQQIIGLVGAQTGTKAGQFPGTQPVTLMREHFGIDPSPDTPHLRSGDYNVTDKADGMRCLMVVARNGRIFMVDRNMNVYGTDRRLDDVNTGEWAGCILDGEWVTQNAKSEPVSHYYAFDIFNGRRGEDVSGRPFLTRGAAGVTRNAALTEAVAALNAAGYTVAGIPKHHSLSIFMKIFYTPADPSDSVGIFAEASNVMDRLKKDPPYHTDGLIFTPNASPLPKGSGKWASQLKWKPSSQNSIDFLVRVEKERGPDGKPTNMELVSTKIREDTNQAVRYKTLRLFVGSWFDPSLRDPRDTILNQKPYPKSRESGDVYQPVEFAPTTEDPMASVCYLALNAGATDAADAAPATGAMEALDETMYTTETRDPISNNTIVEMVYHPERPAGWRWEPIRVRWDKTEKFGRNEVLGTLNGENNANDIWTSIHEPIDEMMIRTGALSEIEEPELRAPNKLMYYQRKANERDMYKIRGLSKFHNVYIKSGLLLSKVLGPGASLLDMSCGQAGDIHKWVTSKVGWVLGGDIALNGLTMPRDGAYARYLTKKIESRGAVPKMLFVQADASARYADGSAGQTPLDRAILRTLWGENDPAAPAAAVELRGRAAQGFDVCALMFSLHYFFRDRAMLDGLLQNIAETLKVGGFFVGCCFDGDAVATLLKTIGLGETKRGSMDGRDIWTITKQYEDSDGVVPATDEGLGRAIDVNFISIGQTLTEYLVSFPYLQTRLAEIGLELLNESELAELGMKYSTNMFGTSYDMAIAEGHNFPMSPVIRTFSFLNRWFIFRRRAVGTVVRVGAPSPAAVAAAAAANALAANVAAAGSAPDAPDAPAREEGASNEGAPVLEISEIDAAELPEATNLLTPAAAEGEAVAPPRPALAREAPVGTETAAEEGAEAEEGEGAAGAGEEKPNAAVAAEARVGADDMAYADGPVYQFFHKSAPKDEFKIKDKQWRRYLSTFTPFEFRDFLNPAVVYPSFEAALGAAKYQIATNKPEMGSTIFSTTGRIAQETTTRRMNIAGAGAEPTADQKEELAVEEGEKMREAAKPEKIRKVAKWNQEAWEAQREQVIVDLVRQRYERDEHFRKILDAVKGQRARLVYFTRGANELGSTSSANDGLNLYGRALMRVVGLKY